MILSEKQLKHDLERKKGRSSIEAVLDSTGEWRKSRSDQATSLRMLQERKDGWTGARLAKKQARLRNIVAKNADHWLEENV